MVSLDWSEQMIAFLLCLYTITYEVADYNPDAADGNVLGGLVCSVKEERHSRPYLEQRVVQRVCYQKYAGYC